jgi:hypothetical protein
MIRETIAGALKSDDLTIEDAADEIGTSPDKLADFCRVPQNDFVAMLDDVCELLNLKLMRVFTQETWELYLEEAWARWGSKEPSIAYAASKAEEWAERSRGETSEGQDDKSFEAWSREFDKKEFEAWEATALTEFESSERERLEEFGWVRWD